MATLYVTEYTSLMSDKAGRAILVGLEPSRTQTVAIGGTSAQSAALGLGTRFVRLHTDAICAVKFGADPTATASEIRMAANQTEFFGIVGGHKVAVITAT